MARPTFAFRDRVQDWNLQSLNFETRSETRVSESQFRDRVQDSNFLSLNFETQSETVNFRVSIVRPSLRLNFSKSQFSESQYRDPVRD